MITVKAKFVHCQWDNVQGASGKVFEREKLIELPGDTPISELKHEVRSWINKQGFVDNWDAKVFTGSGLMSIELL